MADLTPLQQQNDELIDVVLNRILANGRTIADRNGGQHVVDPTAADISAAIRRCQQILDNKQVVPGSEAEKLLRECGFTVTMPALDDEDDDATRETATA